MKSRWLRGHGIAVGMMTGAALFNGNLQTIAKGATIITKELTELGVGEYSIGTTKSFLHFRDLVNAGNVDDRARIILTTDIDLTEPVAATEEEEELAYEDEIEAEIAERMLGLGLEELCGEENLRDYIPVGMVDVDEDGWNTINKAFIAKFDGEGHEITIEANFVIERDNEYAGVFGYVGAGGEIKNLGISERSYIRARGNSNICSYVGGIAGRVDSYAKIIGCYNAGEVTLIESGRDGYGSAGGIVGTVNSSALVGCCNAGNVTVTAGGDFGYASAGGLAGRNGRSAEITGCYNTGSIRANSNNGYSFAGGGNRADR